MSGLQLLRDNQVLVETPELACVKRATGALGERLLCYYVPDNKRFCIAVWLNKQAGRVREICSYSLEQPFTRRQLAFIRYWLSDRRRRDNRAAIQSVKAERLAAARQKDDQRRDREDRRRSWLRTKTIHNRDNPFYRLVVPPR